MKQPYPQPLVHLPHPTDLVVALLREELKGNRFFRGLATLGLSDTCYQPHLSDIILTLMGFDTHREGLMDFYLQRLDYHTARFGPTHRSVTKRALKLYFELKAQRKHWQQNA